jgi:hypothetical protein
MGHKSRLTLSIRLLDLKLWLSFQPQQIFAIIHLWHILASTRAQPELCLDGHQPWTKIGHPTWRSQVEGKHNMDTRDYLAGQAIVGMLSNPHCPLPVTQRECFPVHTLQILAFHAYQIADAMMEASAIKQSGVLSEPPSAATGPDCLPRNSWDTESA